VNAILRQAWRQLNEDRDAQRYYSSIFDRTGEEGFYSASDRLRGEGEMPTWSPNEAYIQSHEAMWEPVTRYLAGLGLRMQGTFRDLFRFSREYRDTETEHRRVFWGQLETAQGRPLTAFMLTVPHSHECFRYSVPMIVRLSESSLPRLASG